MRLQTRTLQYRPYKVAHEDEWSWVIWGLNGDQKSDWRGAAKRVSAMLRNMKELDGIRQQLREQVSKARRGEFVEPLEWPSLVFPEKDLQALSTRGRQLLLQVNTQLAFYKWSPSILSVHFEEFTEHPEWNARSEAEYQEKVAVHSILSELCEGRINRFRACRQCDRWFYAVAVHQTSCSEACRKKHASTSENFKAKRREYMKKYRKQEQAKNKSAKLQVKIQNKTR